MAANMRIFGGLIASERVMMELAEHIGRQTAHEIAHENAMPAIKGDRPFRDWLLEDERVTSHISDEEIEGLTSPEEYTGIAAQLVDRVPDSDRVVGFRSTG